MTQSRKIQVIKEFGGTNKRKANEGIREIEEIEVVLVDADHP
jgi:hypothetical protein